MKTIYFYSEANFQGEACEPVTKDLSNLAALGFLKRAKSMQVVGNSYVVFKDISFKGEFELFLEGEYNDLKEFSEAISSVRVVKGGLKDPQINIYEKENYSGKSATITSATQNLDSYKMNNIISSHKVAKGAWCIYEQENYEGARIVALAGDSLGDYNTINFGKKASSLKPYEC